MGEGAEDVVLREGERGEERESDERSGHAKSDEEKMRRTHPRRELETVYELERVERRKVDSCVTKEGSDTSLERRRARKKGKDASE